MTGMTTKLQDLVEPVVEGLGYELWGMEFSRGGKQSTLQIFIEHADGVGIDDCEKVSRQVSSVFEVEDPITGEYRLEVSSPGIDRNLYKLEHYVRYQGERAVLRLRFPFEGRRKFSGTLSGVENDDVVIHVDDHEFLLPFEMIERANLVVSL